MLHNWAAITGNRRGPNWHEEHPSIERHSTGYADYDQKGSHAHQGLWKRRWGRGGYSLRQWPHRRVNEQRQWVS